jgi:hypothetical protein
MLISADRPAGRPTVEIMIAAELSLESDEVQEQFLDFLDFLD